MTLGITTGSTTPKPNGVDFLDEYSGHVTTLYETGSRPLTAVGGTADAVTATMAVDLTAAGYVDGLYVSITWVADNTTNVTLAINGGAAIPVVDAAGSALTAGTVTSGLTSILRYTSGEWRIVSAPAGAGAAAGPAYQAFTTTGTWTKPSGYDDDTVVMVEAWGGGGGGGRGIGAGLGSGGGGGGYARRYFRIADLPATVSVTIGAGGVAAVALNTAGSVGGNSTFGSLLTAYGGGGGLGVSSGSLTGGGGGGELAVGAVGGTLGGTGAGGDIGGGSSAGSISLSSARTIYGGGAGGIATLTCGRAVYGGGGGAGGQTGSVNPGALSVYGGNGGDGALSAGAATAGTAPAGGGGGAGSSGTAAAGARGEVRVWIFG
jgi:hypothetical protein